jgi:hypothetical protein
MHQWYGSERRFRDPGGHRAKNTWFFYKVGTFQIILLLFCKGVKCMRQFKQARGRKVPSSHWGLDQVIQPRSVGPPWGKDRALMNTIPPSIEVNEAIGSLFSFPEIIMINLHDDYGKD